MTFGLALLAAPAHATQYDVTFCVELQTDYFDADLGLGNDKQDDYFEQNIDRPALGIQVRLESMDPGAPFTSYAAWDPDDPDAGCATFPDLDDTYTYEVRIDSHALIDDTTVKIFKSGTTKWSGTAVDATTGTALTAFLPTASETVDVRSANAHRAWNFVSAMGFALASHRIAVGQETIKAKTDEMPHALLCPVDAGGCQSGDTIWFNPASDDKEHRYVIIHELGHLLGYWLDETQPPLTDTTSNAPVCQTWDGLASSGTNGHQMATKEYASAAAVEGFAHYYAAVTFNDPQQADCAYMYRINQDFDRNGTNDFFGIDSMDCEGSPVWNATIVDEEDYLGDFCAGFLHDRGTELDWLRFFWDLNTNHTGVTFYHVAALYDLADPSTWQSGASIPQTSDDPWQRIQRAAASPFLGLSFEVAAEASNGVDY